MKKLQLPEHLWCMQRIYTFTWHHMDEIEHSSQRFSPLLHKAEEEPIDVEWGPADSKHWHQDNWKRRMKGRVEGSQGKKTYTTPSEFLLAFALHLC